jgi:signal transduction histidine kinase
MRPITGRAGLTLAAVVVAASLVVGLSTGRTGDVLAGLAALGSVTVGALVLARRPTAAVGPALAWCGAAPLVVVLAGQYGATADGEGAWPGAAAVAAVAVGLWPLNVAGLVALLLVFPDGARPGPVWRAPGVLLGLATSATVFALWDARQVDGRLVGAPDSALRTGAAVAGILLVAISLGLGVAAIVRASREGGERRRLQVRWLALTGVVAAALLAAGWIAETLGAPLVLAYTPHLLAIVVLVPAAVGVAILRHDLFDVDRVLGDTVSVVLTALGSAAVFGGVVLAVSRVLGVTGEVPAVTAAFVTALVLLPLHQHIARTVGRVIDRERYVAVAAVERFVADVRSGRRQPEEVQDVLRASQGDGRLEVVLRRPDGTWTDLTGAEVDLRGAVDITSAGEPVARITLGHDTARARRRVAELAAAAWLPIEVSRLRLGLREAVAEVEASRSRLAEAVALERRRLERDLHDGAQQSIVATGMRLRRLQRRLRGEQAAEVDLAVSDLEGTVRELRALAQGVRPARLDDGLGPALEAVRAASPIPVTLRVEALPVADETRTATAYLVVSEAVTNALKHARAAHIDVTVRPSGNRMAIEVRDDGVGGAPDHGPLALRDRVASVGGLISVESPPGGGTTVRAVV